MKLIDKKQRGHLHLPCDISESPQKRKTLRFPMKTVITYNNFCLALSILQEKTSLKIQFTLSRVRSKFVACLCISLPVSQKTRAFYFSFHFFP